MRKDRYALIVMNVNPPNGIETNIYGREKCENVIYGCRIWPVMEETGLVSGTPVTVCKEILDPIIMKHYYSLF